LTSLRPPVPPTPDAEPEPAVSAEQPAVFGMPRKIGPDVRAPRLHAKSLGIRVFERGTHQRRGDAASFERRRYLGVNQQHEVVLHPIVAAGEIAVVLGFEAGGLRVVADRDRGGHQNAWPERLLTCVHFSTNAAWEYAQPAAPVGLIAVVGATPMPISPARHGQLTRRVVLAAIP